jgi:hypothetical protein
MTPDNVMSCSFSSRAFVRLAAAESFPSPNKRGGVHQRHRVIVFVCHGRGLIGHDDTPTENRSDVPMSTRMSRGHHNNSVELDTSDRLTV